MSTRDDFAKALELHQSEHLEQALSHYRLHLKKNPNDAATHLLMGIIHAQHRQYENARSFFEKTLHLEPENTAALNNLAQIHFRTETWDEALACLKKSLSIQHNQPAAYSKMATLYERKNQIDMAQACLTAALQQDAQFSEAHFNMGRILLKKNQITGAIRSFTRCLECDPKNHKALRQLGFCYQHQNNPKKAIEYYTKIPNEVRTADDHHFIGTAYLALQEEDLAIDSLRQTLLMDPKHPELHHNLASYFLIKHQHHEAIKHWLSHLAIHPSDIDTLYNLGVSYLYLNRYDDSEKFFNSVLEHDKDHIPTHINLAACSLQQNRKRAAIAHYDHVLGIDPNQKSVKFVRQALDSDDATPMDHPPNEYIEQLFNQYARYYDHHLLKVLEYQVPTLFKTVLTEQISKPGRILDLGCGTGLLGSTLKSFSTELVGLDLSSSMLDEARKTEFYTKLIQSSYSDHQPKTLYDIIIAGDVLPYIGELKTFFNHCSAMMQKNGLLLLSSERSSAYPYECTENARYRHHIRYLKECSSQSGFLVREINDVHLRKQHNKPVKGMIAVFRLG